MRAGRSIGVLTLALVTACGTTTVAEEQPAAVAPTPMASAGPTMPDLVGLPAPAAGRRLGELELSSNWGRGVAVRCGTRPGSVVRQRPEPGSPVGPRTRVHIRTAALDLARFRGPCAPADGAQGPLTGPDAELAARFYRFAADPGLGAPFAPGDVWMGLEGGIAATTVSADERSDLAAWEIQGAYAESMGPFSALDVLARSGGYYAVHPGIVGTCPVGEADAVEHLATLRTVSITARVDAVDSCMNWWGVSLYLAADDRIRGVELRLGSP